MIYMFQSAPHLQEPRGHFQAMRPSFLDSSASRGRLGLPIGNRDSHLPEVVVLDVGFAAVLIDFSGLGGLLRGSIVLLPVRSNHVISSRYYHELTAIPSSTCS